MVPFSMRSEHKLGHHFRGNVFTGNHSGRSERTQAEIALREAHSKLRQALGKLAQQVQESTKLTELIDILQSCQSAEEAYKMAGSILPTILCSQSGLVHNEPIRNAVEVVAAWGDTVTPKRYSHQTAAGRFGAARLTE